MSSRNFSRALRSASSWMKSACGAGDHPPWSPPSPISTVSMPSWTAVSSASARVMVVRLSVNNPICMSDSIEWDAERLARTAFGQLGNRVDVLAVDKGWTRQDWLAAADDVLVVHIEPQLIHREVPLQVWLLVDGPLHVAGLHGVDEGGIRVERRDLGLAACVTHRLHRRQRN